DNESKHETAHIDPIQWRVKGWSQSIKYTGTAVFVSACPSGFLIEAEDISVGVGEAGGEFGGVYTDGLHDAAAVHANGFDGGGQVAHHDAREQTQPCANGA